LSSPDRKPLPKKARRWWLALAAVLVAMVLAVGGVLGWVVGTQQGFLWAVNTGGKLAGAAITVDGPQGSLWRGLSIERLRVEHEAADLDIKRLELSVAWRRLWSRHLHVRRLSANHVLLSLKPSNEPDEPKKPLTSLRLPLGVTADQVELGQLDLVSGDEALPVSLAGLEAALASDGVAHELQLKSLRVLGPELWLDAQGALALEGDAPFALEANLQLNGQQAQRGFVLDLHAEGSLESLKASVTGSGEGIEIDATTTLALLEGFPLRQLDLKASGIDPSAWVAAAPRAQLTIVSDLQVQTEAGQAVLQGKVDVTNAAAARLDQQGLPLTFLSTEVAVPVETFDAAALDQLRMTFLGGGAAEGSVRWKRQSPEQTIGEVVAGLQFTDLNAQQLHEAAPSTRLSGPVALTANDAEQAASLSLKGQGQGVPLSVAMQAKLAGQVVTVETLRLQAGEARADAKGKLSLADAQAFEGELALSAFDPAFWVNVDALPPAVLTARASVRGRLSPALAGTADVTIDPASRWNGAVARGEATVQFDGDRLPKVDADLLVGANQIQAHGAYARRGDVLNLDIKAPQLAQLTSLLDGALELGGTLVRGDVLPSLDATLAAQGLKLPGDVSLKSASGRIQVGEAPGKSKDWAAVPLNIALTLAEASASSAPQAVLEKAVLNVTGSVASHQADLEATFVPTDGSSPALVDLALTGQWQAVQTRQRAAGWTGSLTKLNASRDALGFSVLEPMSIAYRTAAPRGEWDWQIGATRIAVKLPEGRQGMLIHEGSQGGAGFWETRGKADGLAWAPDILLDMADTSSKDESVVILDGLWDLKHQGTLSGELWVKRRSGDIWLPGDPPGALGLSELELALTATAQGRDRSRLDLRGVIAGTQIGRIDLQGQAGLLSQDGALGLDEGRPAYVDANVDLQDIGWIAMFATDAVELGGKIQGKIRVAQEAGALRGSGALNGRDIRVLRLDDGLRLLDGTMTLSFKDEDIVLEALRFPSVIRVEPRDTRVMRWIREESKGGEVVVTANWNLSSASGQASLKADRYPALQRSDRFVAGSGQVDLKISPERLNIDGKFNVDSGWIDLGTKSLPSLSSDVYVVRDTPKKKPSPMQMVLNVALNLGNHFYLEGFGLDTGITGELNVTTAPAGGMLAKGDVRTKEGRFEAYGQQLDVRRGVITFYGEMANPNLDIMALRTNTQVQAGVRVGGTAKDPRISLVSQPEVSDVEKLSWLILGRGPDDGFGSGDATMLLAAAGSMFGDGGEPLYRQLGLDEMGIRSGNVGSSRGLLPERTVATGSTSSTHQTTSNQFFIIGKKLSEKMNSSFELGLSGGDGVVKLGYQLSRRLSAVAKVGTINGLDLLYYVFFND